MRRQKMIKTNHNNRQQLNQPTLFWHCQCICKVSTCCSSNCEVIMNKWKSAVTSFVRLERHSRGWKIRFAGRKTSDDGINERIAVILFTHHNDCHLSRLCQLKQKKKNPWLNCYWNWVLLFRSKPEVIIQVTVWIQ